MHRIRPLVVALALAVSAPAVGGIAAASKSDIARGGDGAASSQEPAAAALEWTSCHGDAQCARLAVPLDDAVEGGATIDIALVRYRALDAEHRIGSLLMNPGGPGASGIDYVLAVGRSLPNELRDRFDIVGFDPRGVGESAPVDCTDDLDPLFDAEWAPDNAQERRELLAETRRFVEDCERNAGAILPYLQSDRVARDLDRIRIALGDSKLTYLGYSYGSYLGAWYAEQFPDQTRALVLDGPIDPALSALEIQVQQAVGFEESLDAFLKNCSQHSSCAFHHDGNAAGAYDRLRRRIGANPLALDVANEARALNGTLFDLGVTALLYNGKGSWPELAATLAAVDDDDGSGLLFYADSYTGRSSGGEYDDGQEAFTAIGCADGPPVGDVAGMREIEDAAAEAAPRLGRSIVNGSLPCALWPIAAAEPQALRGEGAPPVIVLGALHDPATPFVWAKGLASELESARLVAVRGARHTSFDSGNVCVDDLVIRYLVRLEVPARGKRC